MSTIPDCQSEYMVECGNDRMTTATEKTYAVGHRKIRSLQMVMGSSSVTLQHRNREYSYSDKDRHNRKSAFTYKIMLHDAYQGYYLGDGKYQCYLDDWTFYADLAESYQCIDTEILYLDMRYNLAVFRRTTESMKFGDHSDDAIKFRGTWGDYYLHKFVFEDIKFTVKDEIVLVKDGVETVLHTDNYERGYGDTLNLAMPDQPAGDYPYEDFDYYVMADHVEVDGGRDLYWPDWLKKLGELNQALDQEERTRRYDFFYLPENLAAKPRSGEAISMPTVAQHGFPFGSVAVNADGYMLLSALFGCSVAPVLVTKLYDPNGNEIALDSVLFGDDSDLPSGEQYTLYPILLA